MVTFSIVPQMYINLLIVICFCSGFMKKGRVGCDGAAEGMSVLLHSLSGARWGVPNIVFSDARAERPYSLGERALVEVG